MKVHAAAQTVPFTTYSMVISVDSSFFQVRLEMQLRIVCSLTAITLCTSLHSTSASEMAMGFRVGEVTQNSAIVWTRVTRNTERVWNGHREPKKTTPRVDLYVPSPVDVNDREGAVPGQCGQVRIHYHPISKPNQRTSTPWVTVTPENDYIHQFRISELHPMTRYQVVVETRDDAASKSVRQEGSFGTPAESDQWQNVQFSVVTGQSYWDLDDPNGFHIYPAMSKLKPDFIIPTGDTVYLDSEAPRARTIELARYHWQRMYSLPRHIAFHRLVPGYWEVDDHDSWVDDGWPTQHAPWMNPLTFQQGFSIYKEQVPMGDLTYRTVRWGKGLQIWMVEGRLYRSPNDMKDGPDKTIWGKQQLNWLKQSILNSNADFRVLISPTPIVGPDRSTKADNHSNLAFAHEGNAFRQWTAEHNLTNLFVCCGDRHWQYMSIDPQTRLREFSCGPASDIHAGGTPGKNAKYQPFHRVKGGFLAVSVLKQNNTPEILFRHHDVHGKVVHEFRSR